MRTARVVILASVGPLTALWVPGAQGAVSRPPATTDPPAVLAPYYDQRPA
jgi:hypothetical protein